MNMSEAEWQRKLSPEQYAVLRQKATEPPFSGTLLHNIEQGSYSCVGCGQELFSSEQKFESHCGWPSFFDAQEGTVTFRPDTSHGMERVEINCARCGGHLGHVFEGEGYDTPTNQRYCVNSTALQFQPGKQ